MQLWSPSLIRRYAPPTCTLEIRAQTSPLSQWTGQTVLKGVKFRLSFDDPRLADRAQVVITGEQEQLEALVKAIQAYLSEQLAPGQAIPPLVLGQRVTDYGTGDEATAPPFNFAVPVPCLRPLGLLRHELCLGPLAPSPRQRSICLSATQLFDLADALDHYAAECLTLPLPSRKTQDDRLAWGTVAAAFLVVAGMGYWVQDQQKKQPALQETAVLNLPSPQGEGLQVIAPNPELVKFPPQPKLQVSSPLVASRLIPPQTTKVAAKPPALSFEREMAASVAPHRSPRLALAPLPPQPSHGIALRTLPTFDTMAMPPLNPGEIPVAFRAPAQVEELRAYVQGVWNQLPDRGSWTLEYYARLNPQGYLEGLIPLGEAAKQQASLLALRGDQPVVSPWQGEAIQVRLVLHPDGRVQGFSMP